MIKEIAGEKYSDEELKELKEDIIQQLRDMSDKERLATLSGRVFSKDDLIKEVRGDTNLGKEIIEMFVLHWRYLKGEKIW